MSSRARPTRPSPASNGSAILRSPTKAANTIDKTQASSTAVVQIRHLPAVWTIFLDPDSAATWMRGA
jgi:hypothetical protein